jgi:hypothetical protein
MLQKFKQILYAINLYALIIVYIESHKRATSVSPEMVFTNILITLKV